MGDRENLEALKRLFDGNADTEENERKAREQRLIMDCSQFLGQQAGQTALDNYNPEEMIAFLEKPVKYLRQILGGEWMEMDENAFENLVYTVDKKLKKSNQMIDWK